GIGSPYYRTKVGEWENSASVYGTFDQGGNVWEWNETAIGSDRGSRGGSFVSIEYYLQSSSDRLNPIPTDESHNRGFRVASVVPEPGSVAMLAGLALMGFVWWRRRKAA
ncbi:MAG: PEP-CTERM sorting domain-containing protein, partial [bacterium]|nr:PEP-CTERM sorting domain-containing protein [bacterium]